MNFEHEKQNPIGIFTTDTELVVQVWDPVLAGMTGISPETAQTRQISEIIPDLAERGLLSRFERVLAAGTVEILAPAFHRFLIPCPPPPSAKKFTEMRQRVTIAPLKTNEIICGLMVTIEDVTERMEREIELSSQLTDADDKLRLRAAKAISHEPEQLDEENAEPIIRALGDRNWRVRRELVDGFSRRAAPEAIAALLQAVKQRHYDFGILNSALQILQATSVKTIETLIGFLTDEDADLRMQAALVLGEQKNPQAVPALLAALEDENTNVRYHAVEALGKLKAGEALEPLLRITETRDFFLSFAALDALRQIADHSITGRLMPLLDDDALREAVIETLGEVGETEIVPVLIDLINRDKSLVTAAAQALKSLYNRYRNNFQAGAEIIKIAQHTINGYGKANLLAALKGSDETGLKAMIEPAGWMNDEEIGRQLISFLNHDDLRDDAVQALIRQGPMVTEGLIEKLGAEDLNVRQAVVQILGHFKVEEAVTVLLETLEIDSELTAETALALGQSGDHRAFEPLAELLRNGSPVARQAAVSALKELAHPATVGKLGELLGNANPNIREAAIRVIGHFGATGFENELLRAAEDSDERVQKAAIEQLPNIADERKFLLLIRLLKEAGPRIRAAAAQNLARDENPQSALALREALDDPDSWVRYFAVRTLGQLKDRESREKLVEVSTKDPAEHVRLAAHEVLGELTK
jgi:HEAT repeat protein